MNSASLDQVLAFFYRPQGRIGRTEYGLGIVFIYSLMLAILAFIVALGEIAGGAAFREPRDLTPTDRAGIPGWLKRVASGGLG